MMSDHSQPGLDQRHRDESGRIRSNNDNTHVGSLRNIYGEAFAAGARPNMHLSTLLQLQRTGIESLSKYIEAGMPPVPPS